MCPKLTDDWKPTVFNSVPRKNDSEESLNMDFLFSSNSSLTEKNRRHSEDLECAKLRHQLFLTVFPTSINIPSEYKMSTEKGYPLEETKQSPYAALAFAAASFAGVMSIGTHYFELENVSFFF